MKTRKLTFGAMCLALSLLLPQVFHFIGMQQAGAVFLPMHLPIFIGGMLLGPVYGIFLGVLAPLFSCVLTGMPSSERVLFMVAELATYGMMSGILFHHFKFQEKKFGSLIALVIAMISGRVIYGLGLVFVTNILQIPVGGFQAVLVATSTGLPGIIMQLIFVPGVVSIIYKRGYLQDTYQKSVSHSQV